MNISALQLTSILAIVRFVFSSLKKKLNILKLGFRMDTIAFCKCHCHRWSWGSLRLFQPNRRKVRINAVQEWQGVCWQSKSCMDHTTQHQWPQWKQFHYLCFQGLTISDKALCVLTFGDLRMFWQLLEPEIIFSEICLTSICDLSFRLPYNYSWFSSILATVTVLFSGCSWRSLCPSQWSRKMPTASGPWFQEACSPWGQQLKGICSESHSQPPVLVNKQISGNNIT